MPEQLISDLRKRMEGAIAAFHNELKGLRTGRATPGLLEPITVDAYGGRMPINQVATVNAPEPRMLTVQVWDKSLVQVVEKAISTSGLGLNPMSEGTVIRVPMPALSEERRKELVKVAHQYAENTKVAIRNVRRDGMDGLKKKEKDGHVSEDDLRRRSDDVQKLTDDFVKQVDEALKVKEKDIMEG